MADEELISLQEAQTQEGVAQAVSKQIFYREFGSLKKELEKQKNLVWQVILGVLIASFLVFLTVAVTVYLFIADYHAQSLETQEKYLDAVDSLRTDNADLDSRVGNEINQLREDIIKAPKK